VAWGPFDALVHFLNLLAMTAPSMHFLWRARIVQARPGGAAFVAMAVLWGLLLGLLWEVLETFVLDLTLADTLSDLLLDAAGAGFGGVLAGALIRSGGVRPVR
jgi:VanZ family protein